LEEELVNIPPFELGEEVILPAELGGGSGRVVEVEDDHTCICGRHKTWWAQIDHYHQQVELFLCGDQFAWRFRTS